MQKKFKRQLKEEKKYGITGDDKNAGDLVSQEKSHEVWEEVSISLDSLEGTTKKQP